MGCDCGEHSTYGAHLRAKNLSVGYCRSAAGGGDYTAEKRNQKELDLYASARAQGVQPERTRTRDIRKALDLSDQMGKAYQPGDEFSGAE
jgi:hypothetical protein